MCARVVVRLSEDREPLVTEGWSGRSPGDPADAATRSTGVVIAAVALVALSWLALALAPDPDEEGRMRDAAVAGPRVSLPSALARFRPGTAWLPDDPMLGFEEIPGGPFVMGSDPARDSLSFDVEWWGNGRVQGQPDLPTFYMARYEVTVAQYAAFLNASDHPVLDPQAIEAPPDHPVTWIAWTDAIAYADWLDGELRARADAGDLDSAIAGLLRGGWRVTLPTEAQWEKAARGNDGRIYPWGDTPDPGFANYRARSTTAVGSFDCPSCAHGLSDMSGNVWEWTISPYQPYPFTDADDAETMRSEALWVMRGGSFGDPERMIRAANRGGADPGARRPFIGLRVALVPG